MKGGRPKHNSYNSSKIRGNVFRSKEDEPIYFKAGEEVVHRHRLPQHLRLPEDQEEAQAAGPGVDFITLF